MARHHRGAQTGRRGGAGPAGGLLGGKAPPAAFVQRSGFRRQEPATPVRRWPLLFLFLRNQQPPRLGAEVPDRPPVPMGRTSTPPAIDLLVRLLVQAAGLRPV